MPTAPIQALDSLRRMPKVELHVHLEGGLRPERLFDILRRHALHPEIGSPEDLRFLYRHADFAAFLEHFRWAVTRLRDVRDVQGMAADLFGELAEQNVVYAEVIFSPGIFQRAGMDLGELLAAVSEAAEAAERRLEPLPGAAVAPRYNLVVDLVRNFGPESGEQLVADLLRVAHPRVVGVHLGGDESGFPARLFEAAFARAKAGGLGLAAHAGEGDGPASVEAALAILGVSRIGHGVRSIEKPDLVRRLAAERTVLEICPTSNVQTGVVARLEEHPLPALLAAGVQATLGADDPSYFDTSLTAELVAAHRTLGLELEVLERLTETGLEAAFLPESERSARLADLRSRRRALGLTSPFPRSA